MSTSSTADPEEIMVCVVILGASHASSVDEWARPKLEATKHKHSNPGYL
jgi:hypothetical protein